MIMLRKFHIFREMCPVELQFALLYPPKEYFEIYTTIYITGCKRNELLRKLEHTITSDFEIEEITI